MGSNEAPSFPLCQACLYIGSIFRLAVLIALRLATSFQDSMFPYFWPASKKPLCLFLLRNNTETHLDENLRFGGVVDGEPGAR